MSRRAWMVTLTAVPLIAIIAILSWGAARSGGNPGGLLVNSRLGEVPVKVEPAPAFAKSSLNREEFALSQARGKVVMVDFWSSWCPPCIQEAPVLERVYRQYKGRGVEFVGIAIWDDQRSVQRHIKRFDITYPNALDERGLIAIDYGVRGIPEKYFIDREGRIVRKLIGPLEEDFLREFLDKLLSQ